MGKKLRSTPIGTAPSDEVTPALVKMLGKAGWCDLSDDYRGFVRRGILRERDTFVLDVEFDGRRYDVQLRRISGDRFEGLWRRSKPPVGQGIATAIHYRSSEGELLFGEWREDNIVYYWWVWIQLVPHFPDENG